MPKTSKRVSKTGKQLGRPKKYAEKKEKFSVYNKKKPNRADYNPKRTDNFGQCSIETQRRENLI